MAPGVPHGGGGEIIYENAKDLFDRIGGKVHKKVHDAAKQYYDYLHGVLKLATLSSGGSVTNNDPCKLNYKIHTNVTIGRGREDPCFGRQPIRFSDTNGAYCSWTRIKGNNTGNGRACAPYRRLHLCDQNLEQIYPDKIKSTHNLLVDVLLAAKHEGESLVDKHKAYKEQNPDTNSQLCTALARSFADIGDIIRGKDLYLGHKQRKKELEENLKEMFENIQKNNESNLGKLSLDKIREYWWALNRQQVWNAMICNVPQDATYFREKNSEGKPCTVNKCKCVSGDPPTYFDYVPQYLRWFEEWAEDFCRKRKKKLTAAIEKCRGEEKYCSLNGYDCKTTVRGKDKLVKGEDCTGCLVSCDDFVHWIDKQKQEFEQQKNKYDKEIEQNDQTTITIGNTTINNLYAKYFYDELNKYGKVDDFLKLLNNEKECKNSSDQGGKIDFNENHDDKNSNNNKTFSHTEYCEPCPWCGVKEKGPPWTPEDPSSCPPEEEKTFSEENTTDIHLLCTNKAEQNILLKYKKLCDNPDNKETETWKCRFKDSNNDNCVLQNSEENSRNQKTMPYEAFFSLWIKRMLDDSIKWREHLKTCMKYAELKQCVNRCKKNCVCYEKWVKHMRTEWISIEKHFDQQKDMEASWRNITLQYILNHFFINEIKKAYGEEKGEELMEEIKKIQPLQLAGDTEHSEDAIKILLAHELNEANECKGTHNEQNCKRQQESTGGGARTLQPSSQEDPDEDEDFDDDEDEPSTLKDTRTNPCSGSDKDSTNVVTVKEVVETLQGEAKTQLDGNGSTSLLRGEIKNVKFNNGAKPSPLTSVCDITKDHSNANNPSNNPCNGKGDGFDIGKKWNDGNSKSRIPNVYIRPRREHICTSNLEKLIENNVINSTNVNDTFLVDVLLAAKFEAEDIKNKYNDKNDNKGKCRAVRRSFADLGDIIKGTDVWDRDNGSTEMENHLKAIFKKIKEQLKGDNKYANDDRQKPPYKQLRADWWEANRDQIWKAMQCSNIGGDCSGGKPPYDDYIPQRLRWMTEWAEWYCKMQKDAYEQLEDNCSKCKSKDNGEKCYNDTQDCITCTTACDAYKKKIQPWKNQWQKMEMQYGLLYGQAQATSKKGGISVYGGVVGDKDKAVVEFLQELQRKNGDTTSSSTVISPYLTAPGYIHQELPYTGCLSHQNEFCYYKNGVASSSPGAKPNEKYAFKERPPDYETACNCKTNQKPEAPSPSQDHDNRGRREDGTGRPSRPQEPVEPQEDKVKPCEIVQKLFSDPSQFNDACGTKYDKYGKERFTQWYCGGKTTDKDGAICIPPRRRRLYVGKLTEWATNNTGNTQEGGDSSGSVSSESSEKSQTSESSQSSSVGETPSQPNSAQTLSESEKLRNAFIESAAIETFFLWHQYKQLNGKSKTRDDELVGVDGPKGGHSTTVLGDGGSLFSSGSSSEMRAAPTSLPQGGAGGIHGGAQGLLTPTGLGMAPPQLSRSSIFSGLSSGAEDDEQQTGKLQLRDDQLSGRPAHNGVIPLPNLSPVPPSDTSENPSPDKQLASGTIPPPFLRQMFYTLADYRDILFSGSNDTSGKDVTSSSSNDNLKNIVLNAGGNKEEMEAIQKQIDEFLKKQTVEQTVKKPVKTEENSDKQLGENFWTKYGKDIWRGMICSLTYREIEDKKDTSGTTTYKIEKDESVYDKFFGSTPDKGKHDNPSGTYRQTDNPSGTYERDYKYDQVQLKDENDGPKTNDDPINNPKLTDFVVRPPFFRYLQEWGENFCKKRTEMLKRIKEECRSTRGGHEYCGDDGHDCTEKGELRHHKMFAQLDCGDCLKECMKYKKWIEKKFEEFDKQKNKYTEERLKLNDNSKNVDDNTCCEKIKNYDSAASFLKELKHCKPGEDDSGEKSTEEKDNKLDFDKPLETFRHSTYCKACPIYGVNCKSGKCVNINENMFTRKTDLDEINITDNSPTTINVQMIDRRGPYMKEYINEKSNDLFKKSRLFKGIRKQNWTCKFNKDKNTNVCNLTNFEKYIEADADKSITYKVLLEYWLEDFIEGYYILKKRKIIEKCTENGGNPCDGNYKNDCSCVKEWVNQKTTEWGDIKQHFQKQEHEEGYGIVYTVESLLGDLIPRMDLVNDKRKVTQLSDLDDSNECNGAANSGNSEKDAVECLLNKLQEKISECPSSTSGSDCTTPPSTLVEDSLDDVTYPDDQTTIEAPGVCKDMVDTKKEEVDDKKGPQPPETEGPKADEKQVGPQKDGICGKDGKTVDCNKVGKGNNKLIQVPMDPKHNGDTHRNNDGDDNKCGGIDVKNNGEWKTPKDLGYSNLSEGIYVSPRRQKLCLKGLHDATDEIELKDKLLTVAANEGYNLAFKYDEYKNKYTVHPCDALQYSFYDYEHIILGDDHLSHDNSNAEKKLNQIFAKGNGDGGKPLSNKRQQFWKKNKESVWSAMKCGYNEGRKYAGKNVPSIDDCKDTPTEFDHLSQFFMWFTEWSEDFCNHRKEQLANLVRGCTGCIVTAGDGNKTYQKNGKVCIECTAACESYKEWLQKWQGQYEKQKENFMKNKGKYKEDPDVGTSKSAYQYLSKQLEDIECNSGTTTDYCNCMNLKSLTNKNMPESLTYPPTEIEGRCTCKPPSPVPPPPQPQLPPSTSISDILSSTIPFGIAIAKKTKRPVDLLRVLDIHKGDYDIPTLKSKNRYIPYRSAQYRGKRYIYLEGDSGTDSGYTDHYSDITSSSESEYEELDINDIYVPGSPKYKTLIEVVLEPSKRETQGDMPGDARSNNPITEEEWNTLKDEFISNILQNTQNDVPNNYRSGNSPTNTNNTTMSSHNVDNNTHPIPSRHTLDQKPFIMSIHDRNLYTGEEYSYDMSNNSMDVPKYVSNNVYSGIDLINDSLNSGNQPIDIYDEILKRKENELFGTNHVKQTSTYSVAKPSRDDPIYNQLNLFHKWLDRHRDICEKWENKVDILNKLKEEWNKDNNNSGNKTLNTDVSIQIDMNNPKTTNIVDTNPDKSTMDTILEDLDKTYNEPYYEVQDDIYYDVNDEKPSVDHINMDYNKMDNNNSDVPTKVQSEMNIVNNKKEILEEEYPMSDI
ncbi:erythrocyte membrane protein 1, EMP1 [Plasmodium reichenowi]|uniref:Erythrocyte membrane protein 1, EMP1 n=1 Tax=Plasmodium reichenowi TaxID=5854 RepID=A0A060RT91_PLARE|nr:erythrocyte membrane protein 1, EMP1 [Plasmodium reichenowi]